MMEIAIEGDQRRLVSRQVSRTTDTYIKNRLSTILRRDDARVELDLLFDPKEMISMVRVSAVNDIWTGLPSDIFAMDEVPILYDYLASNEHFSTLFKQCRDQFNENMKELKKAQAEARAAIEAEEEHLRNIKTALFVRFFIVFTAEGWSPIGYGTASCRQLFTDRLEKLDYRVGEYTLAEVTPYVYYATQRKDPTLKRIQ